MNILFITTDEDSNTIFTNQKNYILSLAESIEKKRNNVTIISPALNNENKLNSKLIYEFQFEFEDNTIKSKVYLIESKYYSEYFIDNSLPVQSKAIAKIGKENLIYNLSVYNFIVNKLSDISAICTFGISAALLQVYMRYGKHRSYFKKVRTVHFINTLNNDPNLNKDLLKYLPKKEDAINIMRLGGNYDLNRAAIICADRVIIGSISYSCDLKSEAKEARYCHTVRQFGFKLKGIEKGLEYNILENASQIIKFPYSTGDISNKTKNKQYLQELFDLKISENIPMMVSFCQSKRDLEYSLIMSAAKSILNADTQLIICLLGDETDWDLRETHNNNLRIIYTNDTTLKTQILCSADIYLHCPPISPDGCDVAFSCKCGTIPIVYFSGGAKDIIKYYNRSNYTGNGFAFNTYNSHDMLYTIWDCLSMFRNEKNQWNKLISNAMNSDFSIDKNAKSILEFIS